MELPRTTDELTARDLFKINVEFFANKYPRRNLHMNGVYVYCDGELKFNVEGFNYLYNLYRLVELLKDELL